MAGNITKIKEGQYRLRYRDFSKNIKAKNDREAQKMLAKFVTEVDSGDFKQPFKVTFKEFIKKWLKDYAEIELAPKTVFRYKEMLEARIYKALGDVKLDKIKPMDLLEFYNSLRKKHKYIGTLPGGIKGEKDAEPLSEQTIKHHHRLICAIFEKAIKWEVLHSENPAKRIDAPKSKKKEAKFYDEEQIEMLLDALESTGEEELKYKVITMIALETGFRLGEIMGLEWHDIDSKNKTIDIRQASQYLPKQGTFIKATKNETSVRRISINESLLKLIDEYKVSQMNKGFRCLQNDRLFVTWDGKPMHPYTVSKWFPKFLEKNQLAHLNFHGLRHTSITYLISRGMDVETVAGRSGHSTSATIHKTYSHFLKSKDRQAADLMEEMVSKKKKDDTEID